MRRLLFLIGLISLTGCQQPEYYDIEGQGYRFDDLKGKYLVVNYWATWCAPCIREIPELNEFARENADSVAVWGVNFDFPQGTEQVTQARKMKINFPVFAADPSAALGVELPEVLPTTLIFDPQGVLLATLVGPQTIQSLQASLASE
jgi:thiol-disulfide isomerase/thioredoxin